MRHQLRLLDQNLPGLTRELALACWHAVDSYVPERPGEALYRALYRALRDVFKRRVQAYRFCGATLGCEHSLQPRDRVKTFPHERFPGERIHVYIAGAETTPEALVQELVEMAVRAVAVRFPKRPLHGLARILRVQIEKALQDRIFSSERCGETPLCSMNEVIDPWDRRDQANLVSHSV